MNEEQIKMNKIEIFFHSIKTLLILLTKFIWFKLTGQHKRAQNEYNWLSFFWHCKPDSVYKTKEKLYIYY